MPAFWRGRLGCLPGPAAFSTPSLLILLFLCTLTLPSLHWDSLPRSACRESERASVCVSSLLSPPLSVVIQLVRSALTHFSTDPVIPLSRRTATSRGSSRLPFFFFAEVVRLRASSDPAPALMITGSACSVCVDDSPATATS